MADEAKYEKIQQSESRQVKMKRGIKLKSKHENPTINEFRLISVKIVITNLIVVAIVCSYCIKSSIAQSSEPSSQPTTDHPEAELFSSREAEDGKINWDPDGDLDDRARGESPIRRSGRNDLESRRKLLLKLLSRPRYLLSSFVPHILTKQLVLKRPNNVATLMMTNRHSGMQPSNHFHAYNQPISVPNSLLMALSAVNTDRKFSRPLYSDLSNKLYQVPKPNFFPNSEPLTYIITPNITSSGTSASQIPLNLLSRPISDPHGQRDLATIEKARPFGPARTNQAVLSVPMDNRYIDHSKRGIGSFENEPNRNPEFPSRDPFAQPESPVVNVSSWSRPEANEAQEQSTGDMFWPIQPFRGEHLETGDEAMTAALIPTEASTGIWKPTSFIPATIPDFNYRLPQRNFDDDKPDNVHNIPNGTHWTTENRATGSDREKIPARPRYLGRFGIGSRKEDRQQVNQSVTHNPLESSAIQKTFVPGGFQTIVQLNMNNNNPETLSASKIAASSNEMLTFTSSDDKSSPSGLQNEFSIREPKERRQMEAQVEHHMDEITKREPQQAHPISQDHSLYLKKVPVLVLDKPEQSDSGEASDPIEASHDLTLSDTLRKLHETKNRIRQLQAELNATNPSLLEALNNRMADTEVSNRTESNSSVEESGSDPGVDEGDENTSDGDSHEPDESSRPNVTNKIMSANQSLWSAPMAPTQQLPDPSAGSTKQPSANQRRPISAPTRIMGSALGRAAQTVASSFKLSKLDQQVNLNGKRPTLSGKPLLIVPHESSRPIILRATMSVADNIEQNDPKQDADLSQPQVMFGSRNNSHQYSQSTGKRNEESKTSFGSIQQPVKVSQFSSNDAAKWPLNRHSQRLNFESPVMVAPGQGISKVIHLSASNGSRNEFTRLEQFSERQNIDQASHTDAKLSGRGTFPGDPSGGKTNLTTNPNRAATGVVSAGGDSFSPGRVLAKLMAFLGLDSVSSSSSSTSSASSSSSPSNSQSRARGDKSFVLQDLTSVASDGSRLSEPKLTTEKVLIRLITFACLFTLTCLLIVLIVIRCQTRAQIARRRQPKSVCITSDSHNKSVTCKRHENSNPVNWRRLKLLAMEAGRCKRHGPKESGRQRPDRLIFDSTMCNVSLLSNKHLLDGRRCRCGECSICDASTSSNDASPRPSSSNIYRAVKLPFGAASSVNRLLAQQQQKAAHSTKDSSTSGKIPVGGTRLRLMSAIQEAESSRLETDSEHSIYQDSNGAILGCVCGRPPDATTTQDLKLDEGSLIRCEPHRVCRHHICHSHLVSCHQNPHNSCLSNSDETNDANCALIPAGGADEDLEMRPCGQNRKFGCHQPDSCGVDGGEAMRVVQSDKLASRLGKSRDVSRHENNTTTSKHGIDGNEEKTHIRYNSDDPNSVSSKVRSNGSKQENAIGVSRLRAENSGIQVAQLRSRLRSFANDINYNINEHENSRENNDKYKIGTGNDLKLTKDKFEILNSQTSIKQVAAEDCKHLGDEGCTKLSATNSKESISYINPIRDELQRALFRRNGNPSTSQK